MELKKANTKALIFIGVTENFPNSTAALITNYLVKKLKENEVEVILYNVSSEVPLLDMTMSKHPNSVEEMVNLFLSTELHFWLAPLYHGSIPGIMKNSLDWLEITSK
ncbi:MAG TPA: NAD(P)H-dependent oxidoreductase, partial [Chitinophagaceae bacterium]|nr:NAD(P)H-dependent oxidoreductase [Chitinophagaceae bacterium]